MRRGSLQLVREALELEELQLQEVAALELNASCRPLQLNCSCSSFKFLPRSTPPGLHIGFPQTLSLSLTYRVVGPTKGGHQGPAGLESPRAGPIKFLWARPAGPGPGSRKLRWHGRSACQAAGPQ